MHRKQNPLLLQVGLVDSGKRSNDDGNTSQESRLERSVFSRRSLSVVLVTDDDPGDGVLSVVATEGKEEGERQYKVARQKKKMEGKRWKRQRRKNLRGNSGNSSEFTSDLVADLVGLSVLGVDGT